MSSLSSAGRRPAWLRALWIAPLLALGVQAERAAAPDRGEGVRAAAPAQSLDRDELVERWSRLSSVEQAQLRERYQRYQELEPGARELLLEGGRRIDLMARQIYNDLAPRDRAGLDALSAGERRTELRIMAAEEIRELGRLVLEALPEELRERFENATLTDRLRLMQSLQRRQDAALAGALVELSDMLGLEEERRRTLRSLSPERGRRQVLVLLRDYVEREAGRQGRPQPVPEPVWNNLADMQGPELLATLMRLRAAHPDYWPRFGERSREEDPQTVRARMRLRLAMRPDPSEHVELLHMPREERELEKLRRRRERILEVLGEEQLVDSARVEELRAMDPPQFFRSVRRELALSGRRERR